jgi:hypothetical protein
MDEGPTGINTLEAAIAHGATTFGNIGGLNASVSGSTAQTVEGPTGPTEGHTAFVPNSVYKSANDMANKAEGATAAGPVS